jgi:hypothetical protein
MEVSGRHYANDVPDELFDRAAKAAQNPAQMASDDSRNSQKTQQGSELGDAPNSKPCNDLQELSENFSSCSTGGRGDSNPQPRGPQPRALTN